jgi:hypothetical protein
MQGLGTQMCKEPALTPTGKTGFPVLAEEFQKAFNRYSNKNWKSDGRNQAFLNRNNIIKALVDSREMDEESAKKYFDDQVNNFTMTTERFAKTVAEYIKSNKSRVAFLIDEVGQFVGRNTELMLNLQTVVEDLGKYCEGKAWVIVTSQQELKEMREKQDTIALSNMWIYPAEPEPNHIMIPASPSLQPSLAPQWEFDPFYL